MAQPPTYNRSFSFTSYQTTNPNTPLPGNSLDVELNAIKTTLDAINANMALIQNDDTTLKNQSVGLNQLSAAALAGFNSPKAWLTGTAYTASPSSTVFQSSKIYTCLVSHTAGTFATDLANGKWQLILDLTAITIGAASQVAFTPAGGLSSTDVQAALTELGNGKAATSHTHVSTAISDSTAAGRAMLTAANLAAQQTLLGLGSLAFLNSVTITDIPTNITFSGDITPAALAANTNDWAPTGLATASMIRASSTSAINLTGITGGADGRLLMLENVGTNAITLTSEDAASSAANRFSLPVTDDQGRAVANFVLPGKAHATLMYDATASRWRVEGRTRAPITAPNVQIFTSGTAQTYTTPTDANGNRPLYLRVRMVGGGGGGGAQLTNAGTNGGDTSFDNGGWTAIHGNGGAVAGGTSGAGGAGGTGGVNGTGTLITRVDGASGTGAGSSAGVSITGGLGGASFFGGGGAGVAGNTSAGGAAKTNTGSGGAGGGAANGNAGGSGGGAGEFVEFIITTPGASYLYTVGTAGTGGSAGTAAGGNGAAGRIEVMAHWQ